MVKCDCGMVFLPAFFNGICPKCGKVYKVSKEERQMRDVSIKVCAGINEALAKQHGQIPKD